MASSSSVGVAAGLLLQPAAGMACLPLAGDAEQVEADLHAHALSVTGTMPTHPVPGDGHCFFRSVAFQTQAGEGAHVELRAAVVRAVAADAEAYVHFLVESDIGGWLAGMVGSEWADDLAVQACVNLLRRPVLIWRLGLEQEPTLKLPWFWGPTEPVTPIYLLLDETQPGCEHYNVLVQRKGISEGRVAVEEGLSKPTSKRVAQTSAEAESGKAKRRRFNAPRPKHVPPKRPCKKPKPAPQGRKNKPEDKHEMPTPVTRHRRYTCKTTPPPELRDNILTEMIKVPVTAAGTLHPHRKIEDMIKAGTPTYIMGTNSVKYVGSVVARRAYDMARTVYDIYGTFTCRRRLYPQTPLFRLNLLASLMPGARCWEATAPSHRATRRGPHRCRRRPTLAQSLLRLRWMHLDFTGRR